MKEIMTFLTHVSYLLRFPQLSDRPKPNNKQARKMIMIISPKRPSKSGSNHRNPKARHNIKASGNKYFLYICHNYNKNPIFFKMGA